MNGEACASASENGAVTFCCGGHWPSREPWNSPISIAGGSEGRTGPKAALDNGRSFEIPLLEKQRPQKRTPGTTSKVFEVHSGVWNTCT